MQKLTDVISALFYGALAVGLCVLVAAAAGPHAGLMLALGMVCVVMLVAA